MENVHELQNELADNFERLKNGEMKDETAKQMNNAADKLIKSVILELRYIELTDARRHIPFLNTKDDQKQLEE